MTLPQLDRQLLLLSTLATITERVEAMEKLAQLSGRGIAALKKRAEYIGLRYLDSGAGSEAAEVWLTHMRAVIRTYGTNVQLHYAVMNRYEKAKESHQAFMKLTYSPASAARLLRVSDTVISFWCDTLGALRKDENGRISGAELRRFWEEDKYLLVCVRKTQYRSKK